MNCTNNCNQGRACDCRMDAEGYLLDDDEAAPPMDRTDLVLLFLAGALSGGVAVLVFIQLGRLFGAEA